MIFSNARSNVRRTMWNKMGSASRGAASGRCLTAITVAGSAEDSYALPFETFDDLAHAPPGVFRGMLSYPQGVVKSSLNWVHIGASSRVKADDIQW